MELEASSAEADTVMGRLTSLLSIAKQNCADKGPNSIYEYKNKSTR